MIAGTRVLVVEDEPLVRRSVVAQLEKLGCKVVAVESAWSALELLTTHEKFDLLFSDVVLPEGLNGAELARRARRAFGGELKILLTTGWSPPEALSSQPEEYFRVLRKPYGAAKLAEALESALRD